MLIFKLALKVKSAGMRDDRTFLKPQRTLFYNTGKDKAQPNPLPKP